INRRVWVCDGKTAWYCSSLPGGDKEITKWDLAKLAKDERKVAVLILLTEGLDGIMFIRTPEQDPELRKVRLALTSDGLERIGEEKLGGESVIVYKGAVNDPDLTDKFFYHVWFGKSDGILRKQVFIKGKNQPFITYIVTAAKWENVPI